MKTPSEIIEFIKFIELNCDVSKFTYKGVNFWPLIRSEIRFNLHFEKNPDTNWVLSEKQKTFSDHLKTPLRTLKLLKAKKKYISSIKPLIGPYHICAYPNSVFIDTVKEKKYCRYIDPYYEVLKKQIPEINYFGFIEANETVIDTLNPINFLDLTDFVAFNGLKHYLDEYNFSSSKDIKHLKQVFTQANELTHQKYGIRPFFAGLLKSCVYVCDYKEYFDNLFKVSDVKYIFIEDYHIYLQMAMCASAKEHNIKVIEIQHGLFDSKYFPFINTAINYTTLPDYIWCWSNCDKDMLVKQNINFKSLLPFVGGNMWLKKFKNNEIQPAKENEQVFIENVRRKYKKIILITLQPFFLLQNNMIETISENTTDCFFLIRFHPLNTTLAEKKEIRSKLSQFVNIETDISSQANLYFLFQKSDFHITHSSASATEALVFNVPTIVCSDNGYEYYKEMIDDGVIFFAKTGKEISEIIKTNKPLNSSKLGHYLINSNEEEAILNLNNILHN